MNFISNKKTIENYKIADIDSDSDKYKKYCNLWCAGKEEDLFTTLEVKVKVTAPYLESLNIDGKDFTFHIATPQSFYSWELDPNSNKAATEKFLRDYLKERNNCTVVSFSYQPQEFYIFKKSEFDFNNVWELTF